MILFDELFSLLWPLLKVSTELYLTTSIAAELLSKLIVNKGSAFPPDDVLEPCLLKSIFSYVLGTYISDEK